MPGQSRGNPVKILFLCVRVFFYRFHPELCDFLDRRAHPSDCISGDLFSMSTCVPLAKGMLWIYVFISAVSVFAGPYRERKGHKNLRKMIPRTPAGCPWDTQRDKQGSTGRCPGDFLLFALEKTDRKGHFSEFSGRDQDVQKVYAIFSYVPFLLPTISQGNPSMVAEVQLQPNSCCSSHCRWLNCTLRYGRTGTVSKAFGHFPSHSSHCSRAFFHCTSGAAQQSVQLIDCEIQISIAAALLLVSRSPT